MSVNGSNSQLFEKLMVDVTEEEKQEHRESLAVYLEKQGCSKETVELMRNSQPLPPSDD